MVPEDPAQQGELALAGKAVLITGGSSGIGRAVAELFAREGAAVGVLDRSESQALTVGDFIAGDVRDPRDNVNAVQHMLDRYGRLDVFIGNAGIHDGGRGVTDTDLNTLERLLTEVLEINVKGYVLGAAAAAAAVRATHGCMIFTLSDAAFVVGANKAGVGYAASKHAGLGVVRALASELAPDVRVNAVAPGGVLTGLREATALSPGAEGLGEVHVTEPERLARTVANLNPLGVVLDAADIAHAFLFFATSPAARGMTGAVLRVDGGLDVR